MQKDRRIVSWAGAISGVFLALVLNAALAHGTDKDNFVTEEFHQTYPLAANGRVDLSNINGAVHITAWDQNQVKVDAVKRADDADGLKRMEIRVDAHSDLLSIETRYHQQDEGWNHRGDHMSEVEYTLTVPRNARLDDIKLINGGLDVTGVNGEVRASCINGKLVAKGLAGDSKLSTINGPLEANFENLRATHIELSSVNGPVRLLLPSDAKARIEATTVHGGIDNDFGLHTNNHRFVGHDLKGELGGGGVSIRLSNVNGPIDVRHANDGRTLSPAKNTAGRDDDGDEI
jgi:DUF4097 and DUF4098 domain-containing protein YvlB